MEAYALFKDDVRFVGEEPCFSARGVFKCIALAAHHAPPGSPAQAEAARLWRAVLDLARSRGFTAEPALQELFRTQPELIPVATANHLVNQITQLVPAEEFADLAGVRTMEVPRVH